MAKVIEVKNDISEYGLRRLHVTTRGEVDIGELEAQHVKLEDGHLMKYWEWVDDIGFKHIYMVWKWRWLMGRPVIVFSWRKTDGKNEAEKLGRAIKLAFMRYQQRFEEIPNTAIVRNGSLEDWADRYYVSDGNGSEYELKIKQDEHIQAGHVGVFLDQKN